jgi:hypothetical protein
VTDTAIKIGFQVNKSIDYTAFGGEGSAESEEKPVKEIVKYFNSHGGIRGRKIEPYIYLSDVTTTPWAVDAQASCTEFTEDKKVFAAFSTVNAIDTSAACYAKHDTVYVSHKRTIYHTDDFTRYAKTLFVPSRSIPSALWGEMLVDGLHAQGYFKGGRLGIVRFEGRAWKHAVDAGIKPRLKAHGVTLHDEAVVSEPADAAGLSGAAGGASNAVLRFRSAGIDRVIFAEGGGVIPYLFMPLAESQGYRPRYGLSSLQYPAFLELNVPIAQVRGALGVGWSPTDDSSVKTDYTGVPLASTCLAILKKMGYPADGDPTSPMGYCDGLFFVKSVMERAPELTTKGFRLAVDALGAVNRPALTNSTTFGPAKRFGTNAVRFLAFNDGCGCFRYTTGWRGLP